MIQAFLVSCLLSQIYTLDGNLEGNKFTVKDVGVYQTDNTYDAQDVNVTFEYLGDGDVKVLAILSKIEQAMVDEANKYRKQHGLKPLVPDDGLMRTARLHSKRMASGMGMKHGGTTGWSGENIAWNQRTPQEVTRAWYNSPGHRANMLNSRFTKIGVGEVNRYWTQQFK